MLGANTDNGLTSLSWLADCTPLVGGLDADEPGRRCRRRFKRQKPNRSAPYTNLPQYWASGGSKADFTEGGEELDASRPAFSFTCLIGLAILANRSEQVSVGKIYAFIQCNFPYFREAKATWRNSVRHVLSLNKFFYKLRRTDAAAGRSGKKPATDGARCKGGLWGIKPCMLQALLLLVKDARRTLPAATVQHLHLDSVRARCAKKQLRLKQQQPQQPQATTQQQQHQQTAAAAAVAAAAAAAADTQGSLILPVPAALGDLDAVGDAMGGSDCGSPTATVPDHEYNIYTDSCASFTSLFEDDLSMMDSMSEASYDSFEDGWSSSDDAQHDSADLMSLAGVDIADEQYTSSLLSSVQWLVHPEGPGAFEALAPGHGLAMAQDGALPPPAFGTSPWEF